MSKKSYSHLNSDCIFPPKKNRIKKKTGSPNQGIQKGMGEQKKNKTLFYSWVSTVRCTRVLLMNLSDIQSGISLQILKKRRKQKKKSNTSKKKNEKEINRKQRFLLSTGCEIDYIQGSLAQGILTQCISLY